MNILIKKTLILIYNRSSLCLLLTTVHACPDGVHCMSHLARID